MSLSAPRIIDAPAEYSQQYFNMTWRQFFSFFKAVGTTDPYITSITSFQTVTGDTSLGGNDGLTLVDTTAGNVTVTLPLLSILTTNGKVFTVKRVTAGANTLTVDTDDGSTIDGAATVSIATQWHCRQFGNNGTSWYILATYP